MASGLAGKLRKTADAWGRVEQALLAILVSGMVLLSALQIILRNFFRSGILWAEPILGGSLLWITMLGALVAAGRVKHITVDLVAHLLPPRARRAVLAVTDLFAAVVCGFLVPASIRFVTLQREMGVMATAAIPQWILSLVVPVCFALLSFRFALQSVVAAAGAVTRTLPEGPGP